MIIILLLPYVITALCSGRIEESRSPKSSEGEQIVFADESGKEEVMGIEEYLLGVLPSQIPVQYELEAIKAQAVIARTYVKKALGGNAQINKEELNQTFYTLKELEELWGYEEFAKKYEKYETAIKQTENKAATYNGQLAELPFHAVSAKKTRSGLNAFGNNNFPYLLSVESNEDIKSESYLNLNTFLEVDIITACKEKFPGLERGDSSEEEFLEVLSKDDSDYVTQVRVGNTVMTGEEFRECLNLNSSSFILGVLDGKIRIVTKGLGHGIGMSQYGANSMALDGKKYEDILKYYYQGIEISTN